MIFFMYVLNPITWNWLRSDSDLKRFSWMYRSYGYVCLNSNPNAPANHCLQITVRDVQEVRIIFLMGVNPHIV